MSYSPIGWTDGTGKPLSAENLNHMEDGISAAISSDGDTMLGNLILKGEPSEDNEAATKTYIKKYIDEYANSLTDYIWRDYELTIGKHSSGYNSDGANIFTNVPFYSLSENVNGKFSKIILWKICGNDFGDEGSYFVQEDVGLILSLDDFSDGETKVFYLNGTKINYSYRFAVKRDDDSIFVTYKITENNWRYYTSEATLSFTVI